MEYGLIDQIIASHYYRRRGGHMPGRSDDRFAALCGKTQDQVRKLIAGSNDVYM